MSTDVSPVFPFPRFSLGFSRFPRPKHPEIVRRPNTLPMRFGRPRTLHLRHIGAPTLL